MAIPISLRLVPQDGEALGRKSPSHRHLESLHVHLLHTERMADDPADPSSRPNRRREDSDAVVPSEAGPKKSLSHPEATVFESLQGLEIAFVDRHGPHLTGGFPVGSSSPRIRKRKAGSLPPCRSPRHFPLRNVGGATG